MSLRLILGCLFLEGDGALSLFIKLFLENNKWLNGRTPLLSNIGMWMLLIRIYTCIFVCRPVLFFLSCDVSLFRSQTLAMTFPAFLCLERVANSTFSTNHKVKSMFPCNLSMFYICDWHLAQHLFSLEFYINIMVLFPLSLILKLRMNDAEPWR